MLIRNMTAEDASRVAELEKQCFSTPWTEKGLLESLAREEYIFLVAEIDGSIAGYVGMSASFDEGDITDVAVFENYRRRGVAQNLIDELKTKALKREVKKIFLEVRKSNDPAVNLYKKKGFVKIGERKNFYEKPVEDAILMMAEIE